MSDLRFYVWRSPFGWWVAVNPDETLAEMDWPTHYRSFTRDRLFRKLRRKFTVREDRYQEITFAEIVARTP